LGWDGMGCSVLTDKFNTNKTNTKQNKMTTKNLFRSWKSINQTIKQSEEESNFMPKKQNKTSQVKSSQSTYSTVQYNNNNFKCRNTGKQKVKSNHKSQKVKSKQEKIK
jgi:hypothetical protein